MLKREGALCENIVDARVSGFGRSEYLNSATIVSTFVYAIALLLNECVDTKPIIQNLDDAAGVNIYMLTQNITVSMQIKSNDVKFDIIVHSNSEFSIEAITTLASGYFGATNMNTIVDNDKECPTKKMHIKVDSSDNWRLITIDYDEEEIVVFKPV
jgi:hypothetical protein